MKINREQWGRLSALLDAAFEIEAGEREAWLQRLSGDAAALREPLRTLLAQRARIETGDFLKTPDFAAALRLESARSQTAPLELQAASEVGAYRLLRELGRGGMGSVWLAERIDGKLKRQVALKFPYAGPNQRQLAERLARERDILAGLEHPNIARLYDADVTSLGQPFLVLEYVDGVAINDYCDRHRLTLRERLVLFLQVLNAVQYAHTHLVIHRDLKPSNILITNDRVARLLDFGIAKLVSAGEAKETALTQFGGRALTPDYASPEQIGGLPITTASDVYSLGVVLYELLAGNPPYRLKRDTRGSLEDAIAEADVIAPSRSILNADIAAQRAVSVRQLTRGLNGDLDAIVCKALQKEPEDRYPSVDALSQDIKRMLDGEVIAAQQPNAWHRMRKVIRRNRLLFTAIGAVCLSLVIGAGIAVWQARVAIAQAHRLEATTAFLVEVFNANSKEQADPLKAQQTTARELLDRAAERLVVQPQDSAAATEQMLEIVGSLYQDFGLDEKSAELRRRRVVLLKEIFGADDLRTAEGQIEYAKVLYATNEWQQALAPLEAAERTLDKHGDQTSPLRQTHLGAMAEYLRGVDRKRAREYSKRAIALGRRRFPKSPRLIQDLRGAALIESETGNQSAALPLLEEALALLEATGSPDFNLIQPLVELAEVQSEQMNYAAAEKNFRRALEISQRLNGDLHVDSIQCAFRFGRFLRLSGRLFEAQKMSTQALENASRLLPADETFHLPTVRAELAMTEYALGNLAIAADLHRRAIAARELTRGGNRGHASMLQRYARTLIDMGHADEAQRLLTRAFEEYEQSGVAVGATDAPIAMSTALSALGRHREALEVLDRFAAGYELLPMQLQIRWEICRAAAFAAIGESEKAESILRQQLQKLHDLPQRRQLRLLESEGRTALGRLLVERQRANDAREMLETSLNWRLEDLSPHSPLVAESEVALAECLLALGEIDASRSLFLKAKTIDAFHKELGDQYRKPLRELGRRLATIESSRGTRKS
jgi:serine/threonine-protein kinase